VRFDFPGQVEGNASSLGVIGPDNDLFSKIPAYPVGVDSQCDFSCPAGRDDPVITGRKAASRKGYFLYIKISCPLIEHNEVMGQVQTLKNGGKDMLCPFKMYDRAIFRLHGMGLISKIYEEGHKKETRQGF